MASSDQQLVELTLRRDRAAFGELVEALLLAQLVELADPCLSRQE